MAGMSSASSIFAVVSLTIELGSAIKKIVEFGRAVENAPTHINAIFHDLEVLAAVISQIQQINSHAAFDCASEKALQNCHGKVIELQSKIQSAQLNLNSKSLIRRKWGGLNITLKKDEIQSLQRSIEEAKSTLQLVQTKSLLALVLPTENFRKEAILKINTITSLITSLITQSGNQNAILASYKMQIEDHGDVRQESFVKASKEALLGVESENSANTTSIVTSTHDTEGQNTKPFTRASRAFNLQARNCQSSRNFNFHNPVIIVSAESRISKVKTIRSSEIEETSERDVTFIIYPKAGARLLGISYGMIITAKSIAGWQYSMQPFRAVPETALIYDFCRDGNLEGVRSLFERGEASPWDRDPKGRTPLLVASESLQLKVAKLLLQEGADPHTISWDKGNEPIRAVVLNKTVDIEPKLAMINLLQERRREDYEDFTIGNMIWHALLFYRPQNDISISCVQRRVAILKLLSTMLPFYEASHPHRADLLYKAVKLCYEQEVLQYILRTTKAFIDLDLNICSTIHEAMHRRLPERDLASMELIVQKTKNLHRGEIRWYGRTRMETPTMLAMYDMRIFVAWRGLLHDLGHETLPFLEQELKEGTLRDEGWTDSSLRELFDTEDLPDAFFGPMYFGFPNCERCGRNGTVDFGRLKVDLLWRRHLRDIRRRHSIRTSQPGEEAINSQPGVTFKTSLPYRIVCSDTCLDGLCVAWAYEDSSNDEPSLPLFHSQSPSESKDISQKTTFKVIEEEKCPTANMPGAFND